MPDRFTQYLTVGHSNRPLEDFLALLITAAVNQVIDVRSHPRSKRHPDYNRENLTLALEHHGIEYHWLGRGLGGLRKTSAHSPHIGLDTAFRGFADYMATPAFLDSIQALIRNAQHHRTALMCAERDPRHCHRSLIADYLVTHHAPVTHWLDPQQHYRHSPHPTLRWVAGKPLYDRLPQQRLCFDE